MPNPVSITFLGGLGEIGRNCAAIEIDGKIMLLDCGLMFPEADMLGVDLVLPDFSWLIERGDDIVGVGAGLEFSAVVLGEVAGVLGHEVDAALLEGLEVDLA